MKIGIDARLWNQTGVGRYIRNLINNFQKIDKVNKYTIFVREEDYDDVKFQIKNSKFKIQRCNIKWHSIKEQLLLPNILNKSNLDIVHFPYYSVPFFYKKPFVVTIHDLIPLHFQTGKASTLPFPLYKFKFLVYNFVVSQAAKNAKRIIAPSNFSKKEIINLLKVPKAKIEVVYEGTDENLINSVQSAEYKEHFLYIGNAYPHKNLEFLIEVFKSLPGSRLVLVGKEDYFYKRLKKKAENIENIKFFGQATDAQLSELYRKAKALIIPSFIEGFGLPVLEAMANNCLVLASDIPVLHEVGGNASLYFNPKDPGHLKKLIEDVLRNSQKYKVFREKGLTRSRMFSWRKTAEETLKLYKQSLRI